MNQAISPSTRPLRLLRVDASGRYRGSHTRALADGLIETLARRHGPLAVTRRDLARGLPFVDAGWIEANFTDPGARTAAQRAALATSDELVAELMEADLLVIGVPIYNFSVPAALKAWVDMVARARKTFRYTDAGPEGLLRNKRAWLVLASGGVTVDSPMDFATPYLHHVLGFLGITDVTVIAAERVSVDAENSLRRARQRIAEVSGDARAAA